MTAPARERFVSLLRDAVAQGTLVKLTLGKPRGLDPTLQNIFARPVTLKRGEHLAVVWRHQTRDITKNFGRDEAVATLEPLIGRDFLDAHLFTANQTAQLECKPDGSARLRVKQSAEAAKSGFSVSPDHDRSKMVAIPADASWLRALGVTNDRGQPREGMADKFRQIQRFAELLSHLTKEANLPTDRKLTVVDMGSGKGYLTFAVAAFFGERATVRGIEVRPELVELCNRVAHENGMSDTLSFYGGAIAETPLTQCDILIALHACDTATDDALAGGIAAGATLLVVSPCCQKELRTQLTAPPVLAAALRHGIFQERQAEFVTDALRAQLLEWAGYRTKVFEFISTEHTAKNLMIAASKVTSTGKPEIVERIRDFAAFYGIRSQKLAEHLQFSFATTAKPLPQ